MLDLEESRRVYKVVLMFILEQGRPTESMAQGGHGGGGGPSPWECVGRTGLLGKSLPG